jgi:hypothetical protein
VAARAAHARSGVRGMSICRDAEMRQRVNNRVRFLGATFSGIKMPFGI